MLIYRLWPKRYPSRSELRGMIQKPHVERGSKIWIANGWGDDIRAEVVVKSCTEIGVHVVKGHPAIHWFALADHGITWHVDSVLGKRFVVVDREVPHG